MKKPVQSIPLRAVILMLFFIVFIPFLPLLITWRWNWWEAWVYAVLNILGFAFSRLAAARRNPDILAERARFLQHDDAKSFDKILAPLVGLGGALIPLVAGLDVRFGWSISFDMLGKTLSLLVITAGYVLASYALVENRFFSGMVRIQTDRDHRVVTSGPYSLVRHPGYAGALLSYLGTPIFLNAVWAFIPVVFISVLLIIRTSLEDQALQAELDGYREYAAKVRYRLFPGVW